MNGEVLRYQKIINGTLTNIEKSKFVTQTEKKGTQFEDHDIKLRASQSQLIAEQKKAFVDFKDALKQVSSRLLTVSGMFDKTGQLQDRQNFADSTGLSFEHLNNFIELGIISKKADEVYLRDAYGKMADLFKQRATQDFDKNELIQKLSHQKGQEKLIEELKKATDMTTFIKLLIQAMSQGKDDKNIKDLIKKNITNDYGTNAVLTGGPSVLQYLPVAKDITDQVVSVKDSVLGVGRNDRSKTEKLGATQIASTAQSAPVLNAWNNFFEHFMRAHPEISKTFLSVGALGSALDDIVDVAKPIISAFLAMRLSTMAFTLSTTTLTSLSEMMSVRFAAAIPGIALVATRLTAFGAILALLYEAAKTATSNTTDGVNGMYGSIVAPRAETSQEANESKKHVEQKKQEDWNKNAPYMPLIEQNMPDQKLVLNKETNEYQYINTKTGKVANMGMIGGGLDETKHAYDEWKASEKLRKEYEAKTGNKIIMVPKDRGWFSKYGSINFVAIDADGNKVKNYGRKPKIPKEDMVDLTQKVSHKNLSQQGSLSTVSQAYPPPSTSETVRSLVKKDPSVNQGLSMDMNKIKEQMSTSMQLSRQLLNTPSTMQQRFNFYFTLPQNSSGRIEHSFDNNSVVSRKGGGSLSSVDKAFPNFGAKGTAI